MLDFTDAIDTLSAGNIRSRVKSGR